MSAEPHRRAAFDNITMGWGTDSFDEITMRIEAAATWAESIGGADMLLAGERKVVRAMVARQFDIGPGL